MFSAARILLLPGLSLVRKITGRKCHGKKRGISPPIVTEVNDSGLEKCNLRKNQIRSKRVRVKDRLCNSKFRSGKIIYPVNASGTVMNKKSVVVVFPFVFMVA